MHHTSPSSVESISPRCCVSLANFNTELLDESQLPQSLSQELIYTKNSSLKKQFGKKNLCTFFPPQTPNIVNQSRCVVSDIWFLRCVLEL